jgi:stage II sporulation protein AA (anti-sigma F factor antagonist)
MTIAPFKVEVGSLEGGIGTFTVTGELDQATAGDLRGPIQDAINSGIRAVMVDLTACGFIDSTGLGVIVEAWKQLQQQNGDQAAFAICCPEPEVRRLLEVTGLNQEIPLREERAEAIAVLER